MGVDHCRADIRMTKQFLNGSNVVAVFKKMCCKGMSEGVTTGVLIYSGFKNCLFYGFLNFIHTWFEIPQFLFTVYLFFKQCSCTPGTFWITQKDFTDRTKTFYQSANIKILQNIWENKKRKIKNNNSANIFKYTFSIGTFKTLKKVSEEKVCSP